MTARTQFYLRIAIELLVCGAILVLLSWNP